MLHVLVPTDFSENAWNAFQYAMHFFANEHTKFFIVHLQRNNREHLQNIQSQGPSFTSTKTAPKALFQELVSRVKNTSSSSLHSFEEHLIKAPFIPGIKGAVQQFNIDIIVVGTKGAHGLKKTAMGTRTAEIITRVPHPTLVIPQFTKFKTVHRIVLPTDYQNYFKNNVMQCLFKWLDQTKAQLAIVNVSQASKALSPAQKQHKMFLQDALQEYPFQFHSVVHHRFDEALEQFIDFNGIDMIAMVAKNLHFLESFFQRPTAAKISYRTRIPLLVMHD